MQVPEVRFAVTEDGIRIAYQAFGTGPTTVVVPPLISHVEMSWEQERVRRVLEHLGQHLRLIIFDKRGMGMSDRFGEAPTPTERILDVRAVMDAEGADRASIIGISGGGKLGVLYAAGHPERVDSLVISNTEVGPVHRSRALELGENPRPVEHAEEVRRQLMEAILAGWGVDASASIHAWAPSLIGDEEFIRWVARFHRLSSPRDSFARQDASLRELDIGESARRIQIPTLITQTIRDRAVDVGHARLLAELIPGAELTEFDGDDHLIWFAPDWREIVDRQISFVTGAPVRASAHRRFAVVLFTDLVGSTDVVVAGGDDRWRTTLDAHDRTGRRVVEAHGGRLVKTTGDGLLAIFDSPSAAAAASLELQAELLAMDLPIRAGLHAGEVELRGNDISGAAVNLAARVERTAPDGEVYVTSTVRDLLLGSDHRFEDVGAHHLKGFDGVWRLCRLVGRPSTP